MDTEKKMCSRYVSLSLCQSLAFFFQFLYTEYFWTNACAETSKGTAVVRMKCSLNNAVCAPAPSVDPKCLLPVCGDLGEGGEIAKSIDKAAK